MSATDNGVKRYSLALPQKLFDEMSLIAERNGISVVDVMRSSFKLGVLAYKVQETPGSALVIKEGDSEKELMLL